MDYFPIFVKLTGQPCLVVGAGEIAARKIALLLRAGACITVVAPDIGQEIQELHRQLAVTVKQKSFEAEDLRNVRLVIAATDDLATNQHVAQAAQEYNILVNVVDNPALCSFYFPSDY